MHCFLYSTHLSYFFIHSFRLTLFFCHLYSEFSFTSLFLYVFRYTLIVFFVFHTLSPHTYSCCYSRLVFYLSFMLLHFLFFHLFLFRKCSLIPFITSISYIFLIFTPTVIHFSCLSFIYFRCILFFFTSPRSVFPCLQLCSHCSYSFHVFLLILLIPTIITIIFFIHIWDDVFSSIECAISFLTFGL